MKMITQLTRALVTILISSSAGQTAAKWAVSFDGCGPIRIGMTVPQAEKAAGFKLPMDEQQAGEAESCYFAENEDKLPGVELMIEEGKISRIDVFGRTDKAPGGGRIGMTEARIKQLYPRIAIEDSHYTDGHELIQRSPDGRFHLLFETDESAAKVVVGFRVGLPEPVGYVEGCL
jgi:hypothetical protein